VDGINKNFDENAQIFVSIIIPCRNEEEHIAACLDSVSGFDYPKDRLEVLLVDGMSEDRTREIIAGYAKKHDFIRMLDNPKFIVPVAMNAGIKASRGDILIRIDAHAEYEPTYINDCVGLLLKTGAANAGGRFVPVPNGTGCWAIPIMRVTSHPFGVGYGAFRVSDVPDFVDTVPYGTYRREIFDEIGYFDERLTRNQDNEFNSRLLRAGHKIAFDPAINIYYKNQRSLGGLLHQAFYTAMWNVYVLRIYPYTFSWRRFIPGVFLFYLGSLPAVIFFVRPLAKLYVFPLFAYIVIALLSSFGRGGRVKDKLLTLGTFVCYHLAYGAGTWWGFSNIILGKWRDYFGKPLKV
jgi:glycosyltransferase involved in cell wall biosynthesis